MSIEMLENRARRHNIAATGGGGGGPDPNFPKLSTIWADEVPESFGFNMHAFYANYQDSVPGTFATAIDSMTDAFSYTGARYARDKFNPGSNLLINMVKALYTNLGVKTLLCIGELSGYPTPSACKTQLTTNFTRGEIVAVEGLNEPDNDTATWVADTRSVQTDFYAQFHPLGLPVLTPPIAFYGATNTSLGDLTGMADVNSFHHYPGGEKPSNLLKARMDACAVNLPGKRYWATELGYHNATAITDHHRPAPENVIGVYYPIELMENFWTGKVDKSFFYEMNDGLRDDTLTKDQQHFGVRAWDRQATPSNRRKAAAVSMHNLTTLYNDRGVRPTIAPLPATLTTRSDLRYVAAQKRDGSYLLAIWRDVSIWTTQASGTPYTPDSTAVWPYTYSAGMVTVAPVSITVNFDRSRHVVRYRPDALASAQNTADGTSYTFNLADGLHVLAIS